MLNNPKEDSTAENMSMGTPTSLQGQLLLAMPQLNDVCFKEGVILMANHDKEEGAMGLMVNRPVKKVSLNDLLADLELEKAAKDQEIQVYFGGPVDSQRGFVLHTDDYTSDQTLKINEGLSVTTVNVILQDIAHNKGPKQYKFILGYSGWSKGQLEEEYKQGSWVQVPFEANTFFSTDDDLLWATSFNTLGIKPDQISDCVGNA